MPGPVYYQLSCFACKPALSEGFPCGGVRKLKFREVKSNVLIHSTCTRVTEMKKMDVLVREQNKGNFIHCWWKGKMVQPATLEHKYSSCDPEFHSEHLPKRNKNICPHRDLYSNAPSSFIDKTHQTLDLIRVCFIVCKLCLNSSDYRGSVG